MVKNSIKQIIDNLTTAENQIRFHTGESDSKINDMSSQDYQALLAHLIFLALPSPSAHLH